MRYVLQSFLTFKTDVALRKFAQWRAQKELSNKKELWSALQEYLKQTSSTGCNLYDYWYLYNEIRCRKPCEVLECGTGVSTLVIAHALLENKREHGGGGESDIHGRSPRVD